MKITKLGHSCLLVEMPAPVNRTVLFDPGVWSQVDIDSLMYLDDIVITHEHPDHMNLGLLKQLLKKFPQVRIKTTSSAAVRLEEQGIGVALESVEGIEIFEAKHESIEPLGPTPENIGVHFLDKLTHPGDSIHFDETKEILALPVTAPWGSTTDAVKLASKLKPKYVVPIHDALWNDQSREYIYGLIRGALERENISFVALEQGKAEVLDL